MGGTQDLMKRDSLLTDLANAVAGLAGMESSLLPSPKVISVNGEWGAGKTWLAATLAERLSAAGSKVVAIDLFRFDHHDDPFAVIASSIFSTLKPTAKQKKKFLDTAGAVLAAAAPIAMKAATTKGLELVGLEGDDFQDIADAAKKGAGEMSTKAVAALFKKYSRTQQVQDDFVNQLQELTASEERPVVVILDELDRCRPSFALEVLERVKHLFGAEKIVFLLFWNVQSMHEAIRHTYGRGTDAEKYLSKFVAVEVLVKPDPHRRPGYEYKDFIDGMGAIYFGPDFSRYNFSHLLVDAAVALQPTLRDLQKAVQQWAKSRTLHGLEAEFVAFFLLLKVCAPAQLDALASGDTGVATRLLSRMPEAKGDQPVVRSFLLYLSDKDRYDAMFEAVKRGLQSQPESRTDQQVLQDLASNFPRIAFEHLNRVRFHPRGD